jgi:hypothetical protein
VVCPLDGRKGERLSADYDMPPLSPATSLATEPTTGLGFLEWVRRQPGSENTHLVGWAQSVLTWSNSSLVAITAHRLCGVTIVDTVHRFCVPGDLPVKEHAATDRLTPELHVNWNEPPAQAYVNPSTQDNVNNECPPPLAQMGIFQGRFPIRRGFVDNFMNLCNAVSEIFARIADSGPVGPSRPLNHVISWFDLMIASNFQPSVVKDRINGIPDAPTSRVTICKRMGSTFDYLSDLALHYGEHSWPYLDEATDNKSGLPDAFHNAKCSEPARRFLINIARFCSSRDANLIWHDILSSPTKR